MEFFFCGSIILIMFVIILISKLIFPKRSYEIKFSLIVTVIGAIFFGSRFVGPFNLWTLASFLLCVYYIMAGGKSVALKTVTAVFSTITKKSVGIMRSGTNWADPIFEVVTVNPDGVPNKALDLQELHIVIPETPEIQTKTRGIQAKVKNISFMLEVIEDEIAELLRIEGGGKTVENRIKEDIEEFFLDKISEIEAEELDRDKRDIIHRLCHKMEERVNIFCSTNKYPFKLVGDVIISDTELDEEYYKVLSRREYARLEQQAKDIEATKLRERILDFGKHIMPSAPEKEQTEGALVALGIVKKDIQERKYEVDSNLAQLAKDIASHFARP